MMAMQLKSASGSRSVLCVCFIWFLAYTESHLISACLYASSLVGKNPFQTTVLLVALYLPLAACACVGAVYVPAVVLALLAAYCRSLHREAASTDGAPCTESSCCSPGQLKDRSTCIKDAASLLCTPMGISNEPKSKQRMQACYNAFWRMLVDEEQKAQAKVFALGAREQTLRKQVEECLNDIQLGHDIVKSPQELEAEIGKNQAALTQAIHDRATLEMELQTANHIRQEASRPSL